VEVPLYCYKPSFWVWWDRKHGDCPQQNLEGGGREGGRGERGREGGREREGGRGREGGREGREGEREGGGTREGGREGEGGKERERRREGERSRRSYISSGVNLRYKINLSIVDASCNRWVHAMAIILSELLNHKLTQISGHV
jgi:hypothetical protein